MSGRHRKPTRARGTRVVASVLAVALVGVGGWFGYRKLTGPTCTGQVRLTVTAAPEIAPAVRAAAERWTADSGAVDGFCLTVAVDATDPVDVAAVVATQHGISVAGIGQASGNAVLPDVWIPDSTTWLMRLRNRAPGFEPGNNAPVASSPVVLAMPEPVAATLGWPDRTPTWADLLTQITTGTRMRTGIVEPTRDAAGLSGLLALARTASAAGADAPQATTSALRALATGRSALRQDLIARFPRAADPASIAAALSAAALSEGNVIEYNGRKPPIPLAALYLEPAPVALDYPYAVMPGTDPVKTRAAEAFFAVLGGQHFADELAGAGLRRPDGSWSERFQAPRGAPAPTTPGPDSGGAAAGGLDPEAVERTLASWLAATQSGRMLAVIDVSGSMLEQVPTARNQTRAAVTLQAARRGLALFDDSWGLGLWIFSTRLDGERDYRELVPIGPLSSQRGNLERALDGVAPKRDGDTGLYDTMLAAYRTVQDGWEPGRVNSVVMFTDGRNDDDNGISQQQLLAELKRLADPERPIQVVIIGIGDGVSKSELESITKVTGGGVFITEDPARIGDIFLQAIAMRPPATR